MGILRDFEKRLGGAVEGFFAKAFKSGLQPVELARRILQEMEDGRSVGVNQVWVPNRYTFTLSSDDHARLSGAERALARELEQVVIDGAAQRGWSLVGRPEVTFETDPDLRQGSAGCRSELVEGGPGDTYVGPAASTPSPSGGRAPRPGGGEIVLMRDGHPSERFVVGGGRLVIGRLAESDVVVADPGASRRHAEVAEERGRFILTDLGSTNGTLLNGRRVQGQQELSDGDQITIGRTVLEFRGR